MLLVKIITYEDRVCTTNHTALGVELFNRKKNRIWYVLEDMSEYVIAKSVS